MLNNLILNVKLLMIFNLKLGLRSKLLVYLEREPNAPFKYIRNVNQQKYERGAHNNGNKTRYKN